MCLPKISSRSNGVDATDLAGAGWGVIFAYDGEAAVRDALSELLSHRKAQATQKKEFRYKEYSGPDGYRPGESKNKFLARHGAGLGPVVPDNVPYYLLIVGNRRPFRINFSTQQAWPTQSAEFTSTHRKNMRNTLTL